MKITPHNTVEILDPTEASAFNDMATTVNRCAVMRSEDGRYIAAVATGKSILANIAQAIKEDFDAESVLGIQIDSPMDSYFDWTIRVDSMDDGEEQHRIVELSFVALYN